MSLKNLMPLVLLALTACASMNTNPELEPETAPAPSDPKAIQKTEAAQAQEQIGKLQEKIQDLETRLSALNDKINLEQGGQADAKNALPTQVVQAPSAHAKVIPTSKPSPKKKDATSDFVQNESIDRFREAKILFDAKRFADSILEFSDFVKNESEHPLAPAAQYYVGMSYLAQKEFKLAEEELNRGLIAYPHSSYVPDTLLALSEVSEDLQKPARVSYYKQKLLSNFPNSPQAKNVNLDAPAAAPKKTAHIDAVETPELPEAPQPATVGDDHP